MRRYLFSVLIITALAFSTHAQTSKSTLQTFNKTGTVNVNEFSPEWDFKINNLKGIQEGNHTYRHDLLQRKKEVAQRFPRQAVPQDNRQFKAGDTENHADTPIVMRNFAGNTYSYSAPNDNTLAISNDDQLISAINTNIFFYDMKSDTLMKKVSLTSFSNDLNGISNHQYDPKLIYDPEEDKFIIVYLAGSGSDTINYKTNIIVGFSETNDMLGNWHMYSLPGNPISGDTSWTDYPAITLTKDEFFITGNLLRYGGSWQTSFKQTVVWQIDKFDGYTGEALDTRLWHDIEFDNKMIRNAHPVKGGDRLYGPDLYLLSNRNFTIYSDSIFMLHISGTMNDPSTKLSVEYISANPGYGMPPDAQQFGLNTLGTNDARVLGAFYHDGKIQFVMNSVDTMTGMASFYHGTIYDVHGNKYIKGRIFREHKMEFGYPNISYSGNTAFSQQAIIGVNHVSDTARPGVSTIYFNGEVLSDRVKVWEGGQVINIFQGNYERWGDYTGNQRKYNEPGKVWISGMYGGKAGFNRILLTRIAEVQSPDLEEPVVVEGEKLDASLYPNPVNDVFALQFTMEEEQEIVVQLFDINGRLVKDFYQGTVLDGPNVLTFNTDQLRQGIYVLRIVDSTGELLFSEKIVRN